MSKIDWKKKTTEYSQDKKRLNKRIKELTKSRDEWKAKSIHHKARADKMATDLKKLKLSLNKLAEIQ
jgi:hypothetical protein